MLPHFFIMTFLVSFLTSSITHASNINSENIQNTYMPFKLGFEFQEENNLCPWAVNKETIQKKPVFNCSFNGEKLWHIVIDGKDIEFVLEPFSNNQKILLDQTIESVQLSCNSLSELLKKGTSLYSIEDTVAALNLITERNSNIIDKFGRTLYENFGNEGFRIWKNWVSIEKLQEQYKEVEGLDLNLYEINNKLSNRWQEQSMITQLKTIIDLAKRKDKVFQPQQRSTAANFAGWIELIKLHDSKKLLNIVTSTLWDSISTETFASTSQLKFQPQVTIQYPLEYTIPLWFSLFSFDPDNSLIFKKLIYNLPLLDTVTTTIIEEDYLTKHVGLIFLHALTLNSMLALTDDERNLLIETTDRFEKTGQIDVKGKLLLMSRRPFSEMWKQISQQNNLIFQNEHKKYMLVGNSRFSQTQNKFANINYAEQYFDANSAKPRDLVPYLLPKNEEKRIFNQGFITSHRDCIQPLLEKGIISTVMIRNFDPEKVKIINSDSQIHNPINPQKIFEDYYQQCLISIDKPNQRYRYDIEKNLIIQELSNVDMLSPPLFLHMNDAMGFFKDPIYFINSNEGEAIIEARMIKSVSKFFMKKMGIDDRAKGTFLTSPVNLKSDVNALFSFVSQTKNFSSSKEYSDVMLKCINNELKK